MYVEIPENLTERTVILPKQNRRKKAERENLLQSAEDNLYLGSAGSEISSGILVNMVWL